MARMDTTMNERVAEEIRVLLARRQITATELARKAGMTQRSISRRITGEKTIDVDDLERIARALDIPVTALLPPAGNSSPNVRSLSTTRTAERRIGRTQPQLANPPRRRQLNRQPPQRVPRDVNSRPRVLAGPMTDSAQ